MTTDMTVPAGFGAGIAGVDEAQEKRLAEMTKGGSWLPRISIMNGQSGLVTEGHMSVGRHALIFSKEHHVDLTKEFNALVLCYRFKALRFEGGAATNVYDPNHKMFDEIVKLSSVKDSGCSYGPEFLMWLPEHGYATYFCNSATARKSARHFKVILKEFAESNKLPGVTLKGDLKKNPKFKWWGSDVFPCTTPFAEMPDWDEAKKQVEKFKNPPATVAEKVESKDDAEGGDRD